MRSAEVGIQTDTHKKDLRRQRGERRKPRNLGSKGSGDEDTQSERDVAKGRGRNVESNEEKN